MFQTNALLEINTRILRSITFFFSKIGICRDNVEKYCRPYMTQMTTWRMRITYWIPKATNTHSESVILSAFPRQNLLYECA